MSTKNITTSKKPSVSKITTPKPKPILPQKSEGKEITKKSSIKIISKKTAKPSKEKKKEEFIRRIKEQLWTDFVIGRNDEGKEAWSDDQICFYFREHEKDIEQVADDLFHAHESSYVEDDGIREYLYDVLDSYEGIEDEKDGYIENIEDREENLEALIEGSYVCKKKTTTTSKGKSTAAIKGKSTAATKGRLTAATKGKSKEEEEEEEEKEEEEEEEEEQEEIKITTKRKSTAATKRKTVAVAEEPQIREVRAFEHVFRNYEVQNTFELQEDQGNFLTDDDIPSFYAALFRRANESSSHDFWEMVDECFYWFVELSVSEEGWGQIIDNVNYLEEYLRLYVQRSLNISNFLSVTLISMIVKRRAYYIIKKICGTNKWRWDRSDLELLTPLLERAQPIIIQYCFNLFPNRQFSPLHNLDIDISEFGEDQIDEWEEENEDLDHNMDLLHQIYEINPSYFASIPSQENAQILKVFLNYTS